jgi:hypothetical protein
MIEKIVMEKLCDEKFDNGTQLKNKKFLVLKGKR